MATTTKALPPGRPKRRAFFGAFDADGWWWASLKAFAWFILMILFLGYVPDRAYYLTVNRTIDLGILLWSPINLCPAENGKLDCPPPPGSVLPWQQSPAQLALPAARTGGTALQLGTHLLYIGGSDGKAPTATVYTSTIQGTAFGAWTEGPALPEARAGAGAAAFSGIAYLIGGSGPDGKATNTVWKLPTTGDKGDLGTWAPVEKVTLPEARSGAAVVAVTDGILVAGGRDAAGSPSNKVWKATVDSKGVLSAFVEQAPLYTGVADAGIGLIGEYVWVYGGTDAKGASTAVQVGHFGVPGSAPAPGASGAATSPGAAASAAAASPQASAATQASGIQQWATSGAFALPAARTAAGTFTGNGALYLVGGSDGTTVAKELYWAIPNGNGLITDGWKHTPVLDLGEGLSGGSGVVLGSAGVIIGGTTNSGVLASSVRTSLAPEEPFFQLGPVGVVVPALHIPGEIGQQLGYLSAAGASMTFFFLFVFLGWVWNNKPKVRAWWARRRGRAAA